MRCCCFYGFSPIFIAGEPQVLWAINGICTKVASQPFQAEGRAVDGRNFHASPSASAPFLCIPVFMTLPIHNYPPGTEKSCPLPGELQRGPTSPVFAVLVPNHSTHKSNFQVVLFLGSPLIPSEGAHAASPENLKTRVP